MRKFRRKGAILIMVACGATLFLGLLALVTDLGWTYYHQIKLQTAINAGWKAGFDELLARQDLDRVTGHIRAVVALNYPDGPAPEVSVAFGKASSANPAATPNLTVIGTRNVPLFFANIFGISFFRVQSIRSTDPETAKDQNLIPVGIPHGEVKEPLPGLYRCMLFGENEGFIPGAEYLLRPGRNLKSSSAPATYTAPDLAPLRNTGDIDPDNRPETGAAEFGDRLEKGFHQPLQIHDRIILQPGIDSDTVHSRIAARIASGSVCAILPITDIPPEVASSRANLGARTIYDLEGVDSPEGKYAPREYSFTAAARIIGFGEFELTDHGKSDQGQIRGRFLRYVIKPVLAENETSGKMEAE